MNHHLVSRSGMRFGNRKGGAAVELAVVFPLLLLLIVGVVDYGRVFYTSVTVANAARAGAEYGATVPNKSQNATEMRQQALADGGEAGAITIATRTYCRCGGATAGCGSFCGSGAAPEVYVEVTATKVVTMLLRYPGLPNSITVSRKALFQAQ